MHRLFMGLVVFTFTAALAAADNPLAEVRFGEDVKTLADFSGSAVAVVPICKT